MFNMAHGPYDQNGESNSARRQKGQDVRHDLFTSTGQDVHTVEDRNNTWPLGGDFADEHHQHSSRLRHHNLPVPPESTTNTPMHDFLSAIPVGQMSVPVRRRRTNGGTTRGIDIGISIGISQHQQGHGNDHWLGRGHQHHQHFQGAEDDRQANVINSQRDEDDVKPLFLPANGPRALGGGDYGFGGGGAMAREQPQWHSTELELLGRRNISASLVKDTMSWPQMQSMCWPLPPLAPLPQLPVPHQQHQIQPRESGDEGKAKIIAIPGSRDTPHDNRNNGYDAASQDLYWRSKRTGGGQRLKRTCQHPNCRRSPSFSKAGQRAMYCAKHKLDGMINVVSRKCASPGCAKGPSYGHPGDKKPIFCSGHRLPGHVNVVSPRCAQDGCRKGPSFGSIGTGNRATYCAKHKLAGMVNVVSRSCKEEGCNSAPSFGFEGERVSFCGKHKRDGQRNLISRRCVGPECSKVPSYGMPGDPRPTFCAHHKPPGAINLLSPRCAAPGCVKGPMSNNAGQKLRYCRLHNVGW